jgi:hypothetical protein
LQKRLEFRVFFGRIRNPRSNAGKPRIERIRPWALPWSRFPTLYNVVGFIHERASYQVRGSPQGECPANVRKAGFGILCGIGANRVTEVTEKPATRKATMNDFESDLVRRQNARQGYIAWRMADLPSLYTNLMPLSCLANILIDAERAIRVQYREDQKMAATPWRRIGPACALLDYTGLDGIQKLTFGLENRPPAGFTDVIPKHGREGEVREELLEGTARYDLEESEKAAANADRPAMKIAGGDDENPAQLAKKSKK